MCTAVCICVGRCPLSSPSLLPLLSIPPPPFLLSLIDASVFFFSPFFLRRTRAVLAVQRGRVLTEAILLFLLDAQRVCTTSLCICLSLGQSKILRRTRHNHVLVSVTNAFTTGGTQKRKEAQKRSPRRGSRGEIWTESSGWVCPAKGWSRRACHDQWNLVPAPSLALVCEADDACATRFMWNGCPCTCTWAQACLFMYALQTAHRECAALPSPTPTAHSFLALFSSVLLLFALQAPFFLIPEGLSISPSPPPGITCLVRKRGV